MSANEQERSKSVGDENYTSSLNSGAAKNNIPLPLKKRKSMDRCGSAKKSSPKPTGIVSAAPPKGRGLCRGGGKPPSRDHDDADPKDPIVDKIFFDGEPSNFLLVRSNSFFATNSVLSSLINKRICR